MKVVLTQDVKNIGRIGDVAEVPAGYARNFLLPRKLAELASPATIRSADFQKRLEKNRDTRDQIEAEALARALQGATVTIPAKVGAQNRIHGQITNQNVAEAIKAQFGLDVDRHKIEIDQPIRSLGIFTVPIRISRGFEASITVEVLEESELVAPAEESDEAEVDAVAEDAAGVRASERQS